MKLPNSKHVVAVMADNSYCHKIKDIILMNAATNSSHLKDWTKPMMICKRLLLSLFLLAFAPQVMAVETSDPKLGDTAEMIVDPDFKVPDHSAEWQKYLLYLKGLEAEITVLKAQIAASSDGLGGALKQYPSDAKARIKRAAKELQFLRLYEKSIAEWRILYSNRSRNLDAKTLGWGLQQQSFKGAKALGLYYMADAYYGEGDLVSAINLGTMALKGQLWQRDENNLTRSLRRWLDNMTLRAGDPVYNLTATPISACIAFGRSLAETQQLPLDDYIRADNDQKLAVSIKGRNLCVSGLAFGDKFNLTIRRGLVAENGAVLAVKATRAIQVNDRPASLRFNASKWLAPMTGNETVAVYAVNMKEVDISLYRIGERGLQQAMRGGLFTSSIQRYRAENFRNELGEAVWQGSVTLSKGTSNSEVTTLMPLREMVKDIKPGLYIMKADWKTGNEREDNASWKSRPLQWILFSDTGLTSVRGKDGLTVVARSLSSANLMYGVNLSLVAHNNEILATTKSDANGIATFPAGLLRGEGGNRPSHLISRGAGGDFTLLRLGADALDLSSFDVSGRAMPTASDIYLFTERPVYRAGEKVFLTGFMRNRDVKTVADQRLALKLIRPDGTTDRALTLTGDEMGAYAYDFTLNANARTGQWALQVSYPGERETLAVVSFEVQDFVPLRLKAELTSAVEIARKNMPVDLALAVDFLYGAPASGLKGSINAVLRSTRQPFKGYEAYRFGLLDDEFSPTSVVDEELTLSAEGKYSLELLVDKVAKTSLPLELRASSTIYDVGGRPARAIFTMPFRQEDTSIGVRMGNVETNGSEGRAEAHIISLKHDGERASKRAVKVRWIKEDYDYQWYQSNGYWRSRTMIYDTLMAEVDGETDAKGMLEVSHNLPNGAYRLEVMDADGTSKASVRFHVGWWSWNREANEPDQLEMKLETASLKSGEKLRGQIKAPFDGKATLMVITDRVHAIEAIDVFGGTADFSFKVDKKWGPGAYIMATAYRPTGGNNAEDAHLPVRATGFAWIDIDHAAKRLSIEINTPETVLPRRKAAIPVHIEGLKQGEKARVTMLAVDEGILRLMAFKSPSLSGHYLSKQRLGVDIQDLYGRLLLAEKGRRGTLKTGGDAYADLAMAPRERKQDNRAGLTTRARRAVALVTRDVVVGADGNAVIAMDIPDFVGQLRLMAVAYSAGKMGEKSKALIVRDPIAADLILPRFMAPSDVAKPVITLQNLSGKDQKLTVSLSIDGPVSSGFNSDTVIELADGERVELPVELTAGGVGDAAFTLRVTGAKEPVERSWRMAVRAPYAYESRAEGKMLSGGEDASLQAYGSAGLIKGFIPGSTSASVMLSNAPDLKVDKMLSDLILYRYMCTEQTVSRGMVMLYSDKLKAAGLTSVEKHQYNAQIDQAIERLLMRQNRAGDFGLWRAYDGGNAWASLYAIDFLLRAQSQGYHVPESALESAIKWMRRLSTNNTDRILTHYSYYLRAGIGDIERGDVRHYAATTKVLEYSPLSEAFLAAALAIVGERDMARERFKGALTSSWRYKSHRDFYDYGSILRDRAGAITLLAESGLGDDLMFEAGSALERLAAERTWFNTQQQSWLVRAASVLSGNERLALSMDGSVIEGLKASWRTELEQAVKITNDGGNPIRMVETVRGLPMDAPTPIANGVIISRRYLDLKGNNIDPTRLRQNDRFIVLITGETLRNGTEASLVLDLLPAGLEIENASVGGDSGLDSYKFLPRLTRARYSSELDDRYFAVIDNRRKGKFTFAYMVRAITPGEYIQPPVMVEDMYAPEYRAIGKSGSVVILGVDD